MRETQRRKSGTLAYAEGEHRFLGDLNEALRKLEATNPLNATEEWPTLWVLGLPRSGTTLLTQLIAFCLDVGYVNSLMARFWLAPLSGARLSRLVVGDFKNVDYSSRYGKSGNVSIPHEFSYFWQHWLKMEHMPPYDPAAAVGEIDWSGLRQTLLGMAAIFGKPMVHKALYVGYHVARFDEVFQKSIFLYIERDPSDVAVSICKARMDYYSDLDEWWSLYPIDYEELVGRPYWEQIAGQISSLSSMFRNQLEVLPKANALWISYRELCDDPQGVLNRIVEFSRSLYATDLKQTEKAPQRFCYSKPTIEPNVLEKLSAGLESFGLVT